MDHLAALVDVLDAADPYTSIVLGPPPPVEHGTWVRLGDLADPGSDALDEALSSAQRLCGGAPDAAAAYVAGWLGELVAGKPFAGVLRHRRTLVLDPSSTWVRRRHEGWYDGLAVHGVPVRVLPDDEWQPAADVRVSADVESLRDELAVDVVAILGPIFAGIRRRAPFGQRGMWGMTADAIVAGSGHAAIRAQQDERAAIDEALVFVEALRRSTRSAMTSPTVVSIDCRQRNVSGIRKGTCCLWYKATQHESADEGPAGRYCLACPLVAHDLQVPRWREWLEGELDAHADGT
jgi:hypothetical protein